MEARERERVVIIQLWGWYFYRKYEYSFKKSTDLPTEISVYRITRQINCIYAYKGKKENYNVDQIKLGYRLYIHTYIPTVRDVLFVKTSKHLYISWRIYEPTWYKSDIFKAVFHILIGLLQYYNTYMSCFKIQEFTNSNLAL